MRRALGLRARLLLALLATATVTLGVAALALLSPLREQLRDSDAEAVRQAALATRPELQRTLRDGGINGADTRRALNRLQSATSARVLLVPTEKEVDLVNDYDSGTGPTPSIDIYRVVRLGVTVETNTDGVQIAIPLLKHEDKDQGFVVPYVLALRRAPTEPGPAFDTVRSAFITAALISLPVALLVGLLLSQALVRRLGRLRLGALRLAAEGPEAPPPTDRGSDEIGDLSRAFAAMQAALRRQEEARRAFVATASHELRTPLTSISGNLELLAEDLEHGELDAADARQQVQSAQVEVSRLRLLASELLELSRLDAGVELRPEPVELGELARAVAAEFALRADDRRVDLELAPVKAPVWARADPGATARVVRILLDNGLRFAPPRTSLDVAVSYRGEVAVIEVLDEGPGVPDDERDEIFERFRRGSHTGGGGFGLGLAIGRELAGRMDGTLELLDDDEARPGARFVLTLPLERPEDVAAG